MMLILGLLGVLQAGTPGTRADTSFKLTTGTNIIVTGAIRPVQIRIGSGDSVTISGGQLAVQQTPGAVRILAGVAVGGRTIASTSSQSSVPTVVTVPSWSTLAVSTRDGNVTLDGSPQLLTVETISGHVRLQGGIGSASLSSISGAVSVANFQGTTLNIDAPGGDVVVQNTASAVHIISVNGAITLESLRGTMVDASTVNGAVTIDGAYSAEGIYTLQSHNANVTLRLRDGQNARVQTTTIKGAVANSLAEERASARVAGGANPMSLGRAGSSGRAGGRGGPPQAAPPTSPPAAAPLRSDIARGMQVLLVGKGGPTFYLTSFNKLITIGRSTMP